MEIFNIITQKIINKRNIIYNDTKIYNNYENIFKNENINVINLYFYIFIYSSVNGYNKCFLKKGLNKNNFIKNKFVFFKNILNNYFLNNEQKNDFILLFYKIQKTYNSFSKFINCIKYKKYKIQIDTDLLLNKINECDKSIVIIIQEKRKFLFTIKDLINIFNASLSNNNSFFSSPLKIKNPFNNIPFNKSTLYNIYFKIKYSNYIMPILIQIFFLENFNLKNLKKNNEYIIRKISINNYVNNSTNDELYEDITDMLYEYNTYANIHFVDFNEGYTNNYNYKNNIYIDKRIPKNTIVPLMKKYLVLYILSKNSFDPTEQENTKIKLFNYLNKLYCYNPNFGKVKYILKTNTIDFNFNTDKNIFFLHKHFNYKPNNNYDITYNLNMPIIKYDNFMKSHLTPS